jgi:hypothetical protein
MLREAQLETHDPLRPARSRGLRLEPVSQAHPHRPSFERFIADRFARSYGARVTHFLPHLLGMRDALSRWQVAAGYRCAEHAPLFLEQYLDAPAEVVLERALGVAVPRAELVEVGNLSAVCAGTARALIPAFARHLHRLGYRWVVYTATREVRNSFRRLGLKPAELARADPARLADGGADWGSYYERDPRVMAGRIEHGIRAGTA